MPRTSESREELGRTSARQHHQTDDRTYCIIAEWTDMDALVAAPPNRVATLDTFRDTLEAWVEGLSY